MATLPLASYRPDMARFNSAVLPSVMNVRPAADGWKPLKGIVRTPALFDYITDEDGNRLTFEDGSRIVVTSEWEGITGFLTLPDTCTGLFAAKKKDGTEVLFAGTETALYKFNRTLFVWDNVSSTTYASAVRWSWAQFGTVVYVQNGFDTEQMFDVESDTEFSDNATAPICKYLAVVGPFLFRGNIVSWAAESVTNRPAMIMCSAHEDPTDNVPQDSNYCDFQDFPTGDEVMAIIPVTGGAHIWMRNALHGITITMDSYTFTTAPLDERRGTSAPYSFGIIGTDHYLCYLDDGFWLFKSGFSPIGQDKVNNTFLEECDQSLREDILACLDPENMIVWLGYTTTDGDRKMLGYHYVLGEFTQSDIVLTASTTARTFVYTESDPPILTENILRFAVMDDTGQLGSLSGDTLQAEFGTNETPHNGVSKAVVNELRLIIDTTDYLATVTTRDTLGGEPRSRAPAQPTRTGRVVVPGGKAQGVTHQYTFVVPAGTRWNTASGVDVIAQPGART